MIKYITSSLFILTCLLLCPTDQVFGQDGSARATVKEDDKKKIRFNGLGRTLISQTGIDGEVTKTDSSTIDNITDGEFLLDLAVNATPNKTSEVQAIIRLRNEFGGFFGAGMSVEVRELWAKGIIANALKYRVGDMDMVMSPYTLYSFEPDARMNEAAIFQPLREVVDYEQFYTDDNTRRMQGANLEFGLSFAEVLDEMNAKAFVARIRGTDFFTTPSRIITGGQLDFSTVTFNDSLGTKGKIGLNVIHTFDDLQSGNANSGIRNSVYTLNFDATIMDTEKIGLHVLGEAGTSVLKQAERIRDAEGNEENQTMSEEDDTFLDVGIRLELKEQNLAFTANYIDVGPDFFSVGAQSKRIEYNADKSVYNRIGTDRMVRDPGLFDLTRDRALYTFRISDQLMNYDPRFSNTMPYGMATPNRQGLRVGLEYGKADDAINANVTSAFLQEIRGQGTFELKNFTLVRAAANFNLHKMAGWQKELKATLGYQYESTSRDGQEIEQIDLTSNLIEVGLEAELFSKFHFLAGAKLFSSEGNEYVPLIQEFNDIRDFPASFVADDTETLLGLGIKYEFKKDIFLTLQYHAYDNTSGNNNPNDYQLNQFFALYSMKF